MANEKIDETTGAASVTGFQVPVGIKNKKKKVDEMLEFNKDLSIAEAIAFFSGLDEESSCIVEKMLDESEYAKLSEMIKGGFAENALRTVIRNKVREMVRKKPGGGGYVLYAPNPMGKKAPKPVGEFPTKMAARRAELQRFPPKDAEKLKKARRNVERMRKEPSIAGAPENRPRRKKKTRKEELERLVSSITESIFREEKKGSDWDQYVDKLSKQAVLADKTFQGLQKNILKKSEKALGDALSKIKTLMKALDFKVKDKGTKKDTEKGVMYLEFSIGDETGTAEVGPLYVRIENGGPKIDVSQDAKNSMTRLDPERSKSLRAELTAVQEDVLDNFDEVTTAVQKRDDYLRKIEKKIDDFVADMNALEITMLKNVLVGKYRKIS